MPFQRILRMTPYVSFHIRSRKASGPVMLYCRLSFRSQRTTEYMSGILVDVEVWPDLPDSSPLSGPVKVRIATLRAQHDWIALELSAPTATTIKQEWIKKHLKPEVGPRSPLLIEAYGKFVGYKTKPPSRKPPGWRPMAEKTADRLTQSGKHLGAFLKSINMPKLLLSDVKASMGYNFTDYLFSHGMAADTVSRHVYNVADALEYAVRQDSIPVNPWAGIQIKGDPPKRIDYLSELDLIRLAALELDEKLDTARKWGLLMAYTCLDYNDAKLIIGNLGRYYKQRPEGDYLVFQRLKYDHAPQWGECHIPVLPTTRVLLSDALNWKRPELKVINTRLKPIGRQLNLAFPLKAKHFRKTGALVMLLEFENINVVQKIMGHASVKVTERHYLNMPPEIVHKAMSKRTQTTTL